MRSDIGFSVGNKIFSLFFIVIVLTTGIVAWVGFKSAKDSYVDSALLINESETKALSNNIKGILGTIPEDVIYNSNYYALQNYFIWKDLNEKRKIKDWKELYESTLKDYLLNKKLYYQVRILDTNGKELIVLKYDEKTNRVVEADEYSLQDKSSREYFKKSINLKKGEFFISQMNLNIENGRIEKPFVPVVRYATPIVNSNGETKGVIVLNLNAEHILTQIKNVIISENKNSHREYFLLNRYGEYLYHSDSFKSWSSQLGNDYSFEKDFKGILKEFEDKDKAVFLKDGKIFSMHKIYPNKVENEYRYWYLVTKIDEEVALSSLDDFVILFFSIVIAVLVLGFLFINKYISNLMSPLSKVTAQLSALSKGEIKKENIHYGSNDEISKIVDSTKILVEAIETTISQANSVASGDFTKEIELLSKNDKLGLALKDMTSRLKEIANLANTLSVGNYDVNIVTKSSEDRLGIALKEMVKYLENITKVAESIAVGNLDVKYKAKGEDDRLGFAILQMMEYLNSILNQANAITRDDFSNNIEIKSKDDELGFALSTMTDLLRENVQKNKDEIWFSEGISLFNDKLAGLDDTLELSRKAITTLCRYVDASSGVVYKYDKDFEELSLVTSFAYCGDEKRRFKLGEGIIGQVALEKEQLLIKNIEDDHFEVVSGTITAKAKEVFAFPLVHENELFGVIELMSFESFSKIHKDYLRRASNIFTTTLHTAIQNAQIKKLFKESQEAYEELQVKSEEMQAQSEELRTSNEQMEEQAKLLQIQNDEIEKAKEEIDKRAGELEQSNQYKSEFLANMSHELRTPLNSIILLSSLLSQNKKDNLNPEDVKKTNVIHESGNELLRLINDILDLSKIESGKMELIVDKIETKELEVRYNDLFEHSAKEKNIEFRIIDNINGAFFNDRDRLGQIIRNLISNALKFTKEGSITLSFDHNEDENLPIKISVKDTGIGIAKEKQELIFSAFTQADGSTSRKYGGTGLGLSISKELSHLMGGKISLESIPGEGTTFSILIPSLVDNYEEDIQIKSENIQKEEPSKDNENLSHEQFLIIEDDLEFANILEETLRENGISSLSANSAEEALDIIEEHKIDVAIVDINLPDMNGVELIKKIKENPLNKNTHIQVISGYNRYDHIFDDINLDGYLQKPVSSIQIENTIKNLKEIAKNELKNILIVEDDQRHINALIDYINEEGVYDIKTASSISEAKEFIKENYFDLAIVDLGLNDGSGDEICKLLKETKKDTSILIYTGKDLLNEEIDFLNEISDEIIIKNPNSYARLKDEINLFLSKPYTTVNKRFEKRIEKPVEIDEVVGLENKKVLIVDDDIKNIFVLNAALQEHNMDISHAKNGQEALDHLKENSDTDIVLMDIMMPVMNGYEAMKAIRADDNLKHLPVIAITAKAMQKDKEEALSAGADDYLTKPIDLNKLIGIISMWLNK